MQGAGYLSDTGGPEHMVKVEWMGK